MSFNPNRKFKRDYDRLFKIEPGAANLLLLLCELADETGTVKTTEKSFPCSWLNVSMILKPTSCKRGPKI